jgi:hypothetical protein
MARQLLFQRHDLTPLDAVHHLVGFVLMVLLCTSMLWPERDPVVDQHVLHAGVLVGLIVVGADGTLGLGRRWARPPIGRLSPIRRG